jgi:hypothetical protein
MPIRPFNFPEDAQIAVDLLPAVFGDDFSDDQQASIVNMMKAVRTLAPLIQVLKRFMPGLVDYYAGFVWEEENHPVGMITLSRQGKSDIWRLGNFAMLPDSRGLNGALAIVDSCQEFFVVRHVKFAYAEILAENRKMAILFKRVGGQQISSSLEYMITPQTRLTLPPLPAGYRLEHSAPFAWRERYTLAKRLTPDALQRFLPVEESSYRFPVVFQPPMLLYLMFSRTQEQNFVIRYGDQVVATGYAGILGGGAGSVSAMIDPDHAVVADTLIATLVNQLVDFGCQQKAYMLIPGWQTALIAAIEKASFTKIRDYRIMCIEVAKQIRH